MTTCATRPDRAEIGDVLDLTVREAKRYLETLDELPVRDPAADDAARTFDAPFPDDGCGACAALRELIDQGLAAAVNSAGPRFYHFVIGGTTPAALGADWLTTTLDQLSSGWVVSPLAVQLELVSMRWLRDLFGLPADGVGVMTTGAMMANYTCLAAARQWWGHRHDVDVAEHGLHGLPPMPVLSSGYLHASSVKALSMLGVGRQSARRFTRDAVGRVDLAAMEAALRDLDGAPAIIVANAGEVNAGDFDPVADLADLAERYDAWLHVDGAFGLFCRASSRTRHLADGVERADSVTVDGHKWLNVPYDCGFAFTRTAVELAETFSLVADYLPSPDDEQPIMSYICPESSRRARSLAVWATLRAYGREGVRDIVEQHLDLAQLLARLVDEAPDLERLADVPLNIVCFRYNPGGCTDAELDDLNDRLGTAILEDGRVYSGTTRYAGRVAIRPAMVNWRTRASDIELFVDVVRELGASCNAG